ncbi:MAG: hypothetical protein HND51_15020 [Chloroflexi bacterium]|nr:hypothetical protein [Chloroflexota bacterium]
MQYYTGRVLEIRLEIYKFPSYIFECPPAAIPAPGQYLQAFSPQDPDLALATTLFPSSLPVQEGATSNIELHPSEKVDWEPGTNLQLRGPLGTGFKLPEEASRVALVALGSHPACLLPLMAQALSQNAAVALFCNEPPPGLPAAVEVNRLSAYQEATLWGDYTAFEMPIQILNTYQKRLGLPPDLPLPSNAEVLIHSPMPCAALAACGVCSVKAKRGWKLTCKDGPVFQSNILTQ